MFADVQYFFQPMATNQVNSVWNSLSASVKFSFRTLFACVVVLTSVAGVRADAQNVDNKMLLHPPADSWPGYHGDYSGRRHSSLTQITPANVHELSLQWGVSDEPDGCAEVHADSGGWSDVPDGSG